MEDRWAILAFSLLVGAIILISGAMDCNGWERCERMAEGRGCLPNTVRFDEGECECLTVHGELEWEVHSGCGHDNK